MYRVNIMHVDALMNFSDFYISCSIQNINIYLNGVRFKTYDAMLTCKNKSYCSQVKWEIAYWHFWSWSWSWNYSLRAELELELELKPLELELELKLLLEGGVGVGVGVETTGVGVELELKLRSWPQPWCTELEMS